MGATLHSGIACTRAKVPYLDNQTPVTHQRGNTGADLSNGRKKFIADCTTEGKLHATSMLETKRKRKQCTALCLLGSCQHLIGGSSICGQGLGLGCPCRPAVPCTKSSRALFYCAPGKLHRRLCLRPKGDKVTTTISCCLTSGIRLLWSLPHSENV